MDPAREPFALGDWQVDAPGNRLLRGSEVRPLRHKAMALLVLLARHPGRTVTRDEIIDAIWDGNRFVAPKAINTAVWTLRQALDDDTGSPRYVQTIAKKGYRLIAPVRPLAADDRTAAMAGPDAAPTPHPAPARRLPRWSAWALLAALALAGSLAWRVLATGGDTAPPLPSAQPLTHTPGHEYLGRLSPDGRWLAFGWWQGQGVGQLHLRVADDLDARPLQVSADAGEVQGLAWSPDSQAVAFVAAAAGGRCTLWLYSLADRSRRELARCTPLFTPTVDWSPDGRWIVFSAEAEGAGGLFLVAPDGQGLRRLTTAAPAAMPDHQPAWSPDGQRVAFARQDPADGTRDLYETTLDGQVRRLSTLRLHLLHGLTYSADGQDLVFSTTRQDTRQLLRWQRDAARAVPLGLEGSAPARAADGRLVYALLRSHVSIARLAWGAPGPERVIGSVSSDRSPEHHRASGRTVFVSRRSGHPELWLAEPDAGGGSRERALTRIEGSVAAPAWSPRGERVAFLGNCGPGRRHGLCVLELASGAVSPVAADAASYGRPAWHPQRDELWVSSDRGGRWQLWRFDAAGGQAVDSAQPPAADLQWAADGSVLVYRPRFGSELQLRPADGGAERRLSLVDGSAALVDWRLGPPGVVWLSRGHRERFHAMPLAGGPARLLSEHALGTFPERASFTLAGDAEVLVELANTATADLMAAR